MAHRHQISLRGPAASDDAISAHLFRDFLEVLVEGAEKALRIRIEGRSTAQGSPPKWLRPASDFKLMRVSSLPASSAAIEARPLVETMPERFEGDAVFADLDPRKSPIELFEEALEDALNGNDDSDRFDAGLIKTFEKFIGLLQQGIERVELVNGRTLIVDGASLEKIRTLAGKSFEPQRVRVAGRLETITYSDCRFSLKLDDGRDLAGTATELGQEALQTYFGKPVVLTGMAVFRASGRPLRIEAEGIQLASERETKLWSALPRPTLGLHVQRQQIREEQRGKQGLRGIFNKWPGDETDEQVAAILESMS